jgi:hypothetical protein
MLQPRPFSALLAGMNGDVGGLFANIRSSFRVESGRPISLGLAIDSQRQRSKAEEAVNESTFKKAGWRKRSITAQSKQEPLEWRA